MIKIERLSKFYRTNDNVSVGLLDVNLELSVGEFVAIVGSSGSGKTTLLNVISGMDTYDEGDLYINGVSTMTFSVEELESYRRSNVAFIFQNYQLIDSYTVLENVMIELIFKGYEKKEAKEKAIEYLKIVGMDHRLKNRAIKLSGGEKQRVVIARALASNAKILICDEPTGNLDSKNSIEIMKILKKASEHKLVVMVTHDESLIAGNATRVIHIKDGKVDNDTIVSQSSKEELVLEPVKKNSFKTNLYIAMKNLIRTPKKTLFVFSVFLVLAALILFSIAYLPLNLVATSNKTISYNMYNNDDPNRIVCYYEKSDLDFSGIDATKVEKDYYLDEGYEVKVDNPLLSKYIKGTSYFLGNIEQYNLVCGRLPKASNEIVLVVNESFMPEYLESCLGMGATIFAPSVTHNYNLPVYTRMNISYKVVGFLHSKTEFQRYNFYLSLEGITEFISARDQVDHTFQMQSDMYLYHNNTKNKIQLIESKELPSPDSEVILNHRLRNIPLSEIDLYLGTFKIDLSKYNVEYDCFVNENIHCQLSYDFFDEIVRETSYRVSFYCESADIDKVYNQLMSIDGVTCYKLRDANKTIGVYDITSILMNIFYFAFLIFEIIISLFITSLVTSFILGTKKKELGVLRVIGLSQKDVLLVLMVELVTLMIASILAILSISLIFSYDGAFMNLSFIYSEPIRFILGVIILIIMAIIISSKWNKKMFKKTAREILKVGE